MLWDVLRVIWQDLMATLGCGAVVLVIVAGAVSLAVALGGLA